MEPNLGVRFPVHRDLDKTSPKVPPASAGLCPNLTPPLFSEPPMIVFGNRMDILKQWDITAGELAEIVAENPSMRGLVFGFVAEYKLQKMWLHKNGISNVIRPRSHDRKQKCDFTFDYRGIHARVEVKCLDTPKVKWKDERHEGTFPCNASDTTDVTLPNGRKVTTNCLVVGGFDVLAVCLFAFGNTWRFAFALNGDLPRTTWRGYTAAEQKYLLKSTMRISLPLEPPYVDDLFVTLDRLVAKGVRR